MPPTGVSITLTTPTPAPCRSVRPVLVDPRWWARARRPAPTAPALQPVPVRAGRPAPAPQECSCTNRYPGPAYLNQPVSRCAGAAGPTTHLNRKRTPDPKARGPLRGTPRTRNDPPVAGQEGRCLNNDQNRATLQWAKSPVIALKPPMTRRAPGTAISSAGGRDRYARQEVTTGG
jgi:hypothetical protein